MRLSVISKKIRNLSKGGVPLGYILLHYSRYKIFYVIVGLLRFCKTYSVHPSSVVKCKSRLHAGADFSIDRNVYIDALSVKGVVFGDGCSVGMNTVIHCTSLLNDIGIGLRVGNNTGLGTHSFYGCGGGIIIGDNVMVGNYVSLHSENHIFSDKEKTIRSQGVSHQGIVIGNDVWIGAKVTILDGTNIGDGCVIAAGAVCRGSYPSNAIIGGVPAKVLKFR